MTTKKTTVSYPLEDENYLKPFDVAYSKKSECLEFCKNNSLDSSSKEADFSKTLTYISGNKENIRKSFIWSILSSVCKTSHLLKNEKSTPEEDVLSLRTSYVFSAIFFFSLTRFFVGHLSTKTSKPDVMKSWIKTGELFDSAFTMEVNKIDDKSNKTNPLRFTGGDLKSALRKFVALLGDEDKHLNKIVSDFKQVDKKNKLIQFCKTFFKTDIPIYLTNISLYIRDNETVASQIKKHLDSDVNTLKDILSADDEKIGAKFEKLMKSLSDILFSDKPKPWVEYITDTYIKYRGIDPQASKSAVSSTTTSSSSSTAKVSSLESKLSEMSDEFPDDDILSGVEDTPITSVTTTSSSSIKSAESTAKNEATKSPAKSLASSSSNGSSSKRKAEEISSTPTDSKNDSSDVNSNKKLRLSYIESILDYAGKLKSMPEPATVSIADKEKLDAELAKLKSELKEVKDSLEKAKSKISELEEQLKSKEEEAASRDQAAAEEKEKLEDTISKLKRKLVAMAEAV